LTWSRGTSGHRAAILRSETRYERYSRQMPLQTNCVTFEDRRVPRRRVRRMFKPNSRDRCSRGSHLVRLFRPQNCSAAAHALAETGRVEDDPKLSRVYSGFYLQGDRSTTYAERAADTKLARLRRRPRGRERDCRFRRKPLARDFGSLSKPRSFGGCCCGNFRLGLRQHGPQRDRERDKRLVEIRGGEQSCGRYFSVLPWSVL